jgi:hypothetical protein
MSYSGTLCLEALPCSPIFVTVMMEALHSPEKSVLTRATQSNIPEDGVHHSHVSLFSVFSYREL